ncbi:TPM domain-containing protein [Luteibaculum oceani]|uniref:TPM domain-containing protein n=1 Tax=Luteibaculum oceani TaxID=1294296 RepID=A0A5C6V962_9FLAO|nr:TPM domain-containing protein [Luteibaculum oceani]TXC81963.1 TPM domain-containing protein [Luteibaculum oceani]
MIFRTVKLVLLLAFLFLGSGISFANDAFIPKVNAFVTDNSGILSPQEVNALNRRLQSFSDQTSNQIAILITNDIGDYEIADFTIAFGHKNGLGQKDLDNGVAIVIKPKTSISRGQMFIASGYGLEGAIPDAIAKQIVENQFIPHFKQGDYLGGIVSGLNVIEKLCRGEISTDQYKKKYAKKNDGWPVAIIILIIFIYVFFSRVRGAGRYARNNDLPLWIALGMMNSSRQSHRGFFNDFSSGSGGFGGFGGGGFGGGGAGGSW